MQSNTDPVTPDIPKLPTVHRYDLCGVPISAVAPRAAAETIVQAALGGCAFEVHLCNAFTLSLLAQDEQLHRALLSADLNLPDGTPAAWLGRRHGTRGPVRGTTLVGEVVRLGVIVGLRHYFYGGAEGVVLDVAARLAEQAPGVEIVGLETPPYSDLDDIELIALSDRIRASGAQVVWVGLGTPRQDYLVPRLANFLDVVIVPVGAAFNFLAGHIQEAPAVLHGTGLEWLYRLCTEPQRLWRRYLIGNPRFLLNVVRARRTR